VVAEALVPYRKLISLVDRRHLALMQASSLPRWLVEDDAGCRQILLEQTVKFRLRRFVEGRGHQETDAGRALVPSQSCPLSAFYKGRMPSYGSADSDAEQRT